MSGNTTPRDYVVTMRLTPIGKEPSPADVVERLPITAYDYNEAMMQALIGLDARIGGLADHGLKPTIINVEPDCAKAAERTLQLLQDVALGLMPSGGSA